MTLCRLACGDSKMKTQFAGVFASDTLPKYKENFTKFIVNLDGKQLPGSHWCVVMFEHEKAIFVDSYGRPPRVKTILQFMKRNSKHIFYNPVCYQDVMTTTCGYFCLYFIYMFSRKIPFVDLKSGNTVYNEKFIQKFVKSLKFSNCCFQHFTAYQSCVALANAQQTISENSINTRALK